MSFSPQSIYCLSLQSVRKRVHHFVYGVPHNRLELPDALLFMNGLDCVDNSEKRLFLFLSAIMDRLEYRGNQEPTEVYDEQG
jgi:hypothetical protein